ncbi:MULTISPECIES: DoxX family protein [unclassified Streptomyces]|uniref:DoxX family protein n=1 Tax=unclassified Streptomyces TaxID=2593676 RepID=UPI0022510A94|nr:MULTISPECIES: DoxX family protein [unclassified Streptomyces]MCX4626575.1 DoxX family protein [Streptomyces sp. NBC_01443]WSW42754.1 DoxX family protein [Streptomyces sp. NBC_01001]
MDVLVLIGRLLFIGLFAASGVNHLTQTKAMAGYAASRGLPLAVPATVASGLAMLVGAVSVGVGLWADIGALLLAAFSFSVAVLMHGFWAEKDPQAKMMEQVQFFKDVSLGGAALVMFAFFAYAGHDLGLMVTGPALSLG